MNEETLYKTDKPLNQKSECHGLSIKAIPGLIGERVWAFRAFHGWWDEASKEYILSRTTINTEEEGIALEDAQRMLGEAKAHLVRNGFVHSFTPDQSDNSKYEYRLLSPK